MKFRVPDNIRVFLSKKYLDWAEDLPKKFGNNSITYLQELREHQRRMSESAYKAAKSPKGIEMEYLYFRLIEIFHIEEFDKLKQGLMRLFPWLEGNYRFQDFQTDFSRYAKTITGGVTRKLGYINRESKRKFLPIERSLEIKGLPSEVNKIEVTLHKFLPSLFAITLDVHLTSEATKHLFELQRKHYLPRIRFSNLAPWKIRRSGYSEEPASSVITQQIWGWIDNLRSGVEKYIRRYLNGYFMQQITDKAPRLPAMEVYGMKGLPKDKEVFETWAMDSYGWYRSLGFRFNLPFYIFGDGRVLFVWNDNNPTLGYTAHRLVVLWEQYLSSIKSDGFDRERDAIVYYTEDTLNAILPYTIVIEYLRSSRRKIEELRQDVFRSMKLGFFLRRLNRYIKRSIMIKQENRFRERISMEFEQQISSIHHEMKPIEKMKRFKTLSKTNKDENLRVVMSEFIKRNNKLLQEHLTFMTNSFSEYLTTLNMKAIYSLQRTIVVLTIILVIIAIGTNWTNIKRFLYGLIQIMTNGLFSR